MDGRGGIDTGLPAHFIVAEDRRVLACASASKADRRSGSSRYSAVSTSTGSTPVALRAGMNAAIAATPPITAATVT